MNTLANPFFILISLFAVFSSPVVANSNQDSKAKEGSKLSEHQLTLKTEKVIAFKDGYCLIIKKGTAKTNAAGHCFTDEVPDSAVLGSFWAIPESGTIKNMVAGWIENDFETKQEFTCTTTLEIIKANTGKSCSFISNHGVQMHGTIKEVLTRDQMVATDMRSLASIRFESAISSQALRSVAPNSQPTIMTSSMQGDHFILGTDAGDVLFRVGEVRQLTIDEMETKIERTIHETAKHKRLKLEFDEANSDVEITMMYFRPGVRWIPTYRVNLQEGLDLGADHELGDNEKVAEIMMQGELLNEAEDLIDMPIDVVVGVPNFRFRDLPSPMVLEGVLRNTLAQAAPQLMGNQSSMSNALYTQRSSEFRSQRAVGGAPVDIKLPASLSGQSTNDLFVYSLPKMTLKKGERASVPIMRTKVRYRDVYTWDISLKHSDITHSGATSNSPLKLSENQVWRQIELINDTEFPWTTGAAMIVDGFQPLAQELLTYTSPGGICRVPVTVAVDLRGKVEDYETDRKLEDMVWSGNRYARIMGKIEIELANNKLGPVDVEVKLRFGGKADEVTDEGQIRLESFRQEDWHHYHGHPAVNHSSQVTWRATIEPEECFKPTVDYHFFSRH